MTFTPLKIAGILFIFFALITIVSLTCNNIKDKKDNKVIVKDQEDIKKLYRKDSLIREIQIERDKRRLIDSTKYAERDRQDEILSRKEKEFRDNIKPVDLKPSIKTEKRHEEVKKAKSIPTNDYINMLRRIRTDTTEF